MNKLSLLKDTNRLNELISLEVNRYINRKISKDITIKQHLTIIYIGNTRSTTAGNIGKILDISKSSVSQLLNRMETKNLIHRELNRENKKEIIVSLAKGGEEYFKRYLDIKESVLNEYFSFLNMDEIQTLYSLNNKILKHIRSKNGI